MENGPEKVRVFDENNVLKRDKHGTGVEFREFQLFRKKKENGGEKGAQKSSKTLQKRSRGGPESSVSVPRGDFKKHDFLDVKKTEKERRKIEKIRPWNAQGLRHDQRVMLEWWMSPRAQPQGRG